MRKKHFIFSVIVVCCIAYSCKKTSSTKQQVYNPTSASLTYPSFVVAHMGAPTIPADNPLTTQGIALGRKLFYEKMLSADNTLNCASCHKQGNSFDDSSAFSKGVNGTPGVRNAMPIINMAWSDRFFWDGRRNSLEGQAHDPVANPIEMANNWPTVVQRLQKDPNYPNMFYSAFGTNTIDSNLVVKAIAQFERTLISFNSPYDQYAYLNTITFNSHQANGYELFQVFHCTSCHSYGLFTDHSFRNNGLDASPADSGLAAFTHNPADYGKFKVPSLRNVALTAPYMHDGRFATLEAVLFFYSKGVNHNSPNIDSNMAPFGMGMPMTAQQQSDIIEFLKTLTDSSFIATAAYSAD